MKENNIRYRYYSINCCTQSVHSIAGMERLSRFHSWTRHDIRLLKLALHDPRGVRATPNPRCWLFRVSNPEPIDCICFPLFVHVSTMS